MRHLPLGQPSGACGWTMTDSLRACIDNNGPSCVGLPSDHRDASCDVAPE